MQKLRGHFLVLLYGVFCLVGIFSLSIANAEDKGYLTISVMSNQNSMPISGAEIQIHTTSNYSSPGIPSRKTIYADSNGKAKFLNVTRKGLKQGGSKKNRSAYRRFQFDITASAPGFSKSHKRIFLDYEKPRPHAYLYLAPISTSKRQNKKSNPNNSNPFEQTFYCPQSNDCSEKGEKVVCRQIGGRWECFAGTLSAQSHSLNETMGMACGCMNAQNWDTKQRNRSNSTHIYESHSLPKSSKYNTERNEEDSDRIKF